jgi:hypothetical protein
MMSSSCLWRRARRRVALLGLGLSLLGIVGAKVSALELTNVFGKGPYLQAPGAETMTIMWESPINGPGLVHYGLDGRTNSVFRLEMPRELLAITNYSVTNITAEPKTNVTKVFVTNLVYIYEATLKNLQPSSAYTYSAELEDLSTPPKHFKTFGAHPSRVTFIAYGDTRTNPKTHAALVANFKQYSPAFILHMGDLVEDGKRYDLWAKEFFGPLSGVIDEVPFLPVIGNHEQDGTNYLEYVHLPGRELWYSYDVGPVHVLSLDYRFEKATDEQFAFAKGDLHRSRAPWKIVMLHYPVFNIGGHGTGWGHAHYLPLFHEAKVDLVIGGHSHIYERFRPIAGNRGAAAWPITYVTTGGGGAPLANIHDHPALAFRAATNHFVLIEATPTHLRGSAITTNNAVVDSFELRKNGGRPPLRYYRDVYPEAALKLSFETPASLAGTAAAMPTTNSPAPVTFSVRPLKHSKAPLEMEISLTPTAAQYYSLEGGSLRITTPSVTQSNRTASVQVRATGKKKIVTEGKDKDFSPALTFQARILAGGVESMAYGPNCKLKEPVSETVKKPEETAAAK